MEDEEGFGRNGFNNKNGGEEGWRHDKFSELDSGFKGKRGGKGYKNHGYRGDHRDNHDFNRAWAHDKYDQFERGFDRPPMEKPPPREREGGRERGYFKKKRRWQSNNFEDKKQDKKQEKKQEKKQDKKQDHSQKSKPSNGKIGKMIIKVVKGEGSPSESTISLNSVENNFKESVANFEKKLDSFLKASNLNFKQKSETKIAIVSEMLRKVQGGNQRYRILLNRLIKDYIKNVENGDNSHKNGDGFGNRGKNGGHHVSKGGKYIHTKNYGNHNRKKYHQYEKG